VSLLWPVSIAVLLASVSALAADKPPEAPAEQRSAPQSPLASEPLDRLSATREHPLFSPTRRPPPPPPPVVHTAEPPPPPPPPPSVTLSGVVMDGDEFRAIIRTGPAAGTMRVRVGDDIGGWKVAQIEARRLVLVLDDRVATFSMFAGNDANGAARGGPQTPTGGPDSKSQSPQQNQSPPREPAPPAPSPRRRRGSVSVPNTVRSIRLVSTVAPRMPPGRRPAKVSTPGGTVGATVGAVDHDVGFATLEGPSVNDRPPVSRALPITCLIGGHGRRQSQCNVVTIAVDFAYKMA
jgi:hypothetical protein